MNEPVMRAKFRVDDVSTTRDRDGNIYAEVLTFKAVFKSEYPDDGSDENNTYALWTPIAKLEMFVQNPALLGKFSVGQEFYVDFTSAQ